MTTCFHKYTPPEGQTQVIARAQSISLIRCLFRLVKCKFTEPLYKSAWYTLLSLLIFSTYALSIKREGHNLKKKKKKKKREISRLLRLLHSSAVMLSKARYCDIAVIATALVVFLSSLLSFLLFLYHTSIHLLAALFVPYCRPCCVHECVVLVKCDVDIYNFLSLIRFLSRFKRMAYGNRSVFFISNLYTATLKLN